jgi:histone deacetylase 1/2
VVKLIKNIYGLADAGLNWHEHIKKGLYDYGFKQSEVDPCLFIKGQVLFILYVDNAICLTPNPKDADNLIADLKGRGYVLTDEGEMAAYLGLQVTKHEDGTMTLVQPAFIERIISQCGLDDAKMHDTPATEILHRDEKGAPRKNNFHYRSVIGQLNYLAATTRPEIQFAVHQCARFCENPKESHERAIKRILRYLKRTKDKGLILSMNASKGLECYVDADFAGGYRKEDTSNPRDLLSRCGYVIKYANCPIVWSSKLLSTLSMSSTEAEYQSMSMAMREMIFLINLTDELQKFGVKLIAEKPKVKCTVFEDNAGAIELAKLPKLRPRTKHLAIQYHHFRHWTCRGINGEPPRVNVEYINTKDQQADIFTKPLPREAFQRLRRALCGW